jgi:hypothetical protein
VPLALVRLLPIILSAALRTFAPVASKLLERNDDEAYAATIARAAMSHREGVNKTIVDLEKDRKQKLRTELWERFNMNVSDILGPLPDEFDYKTQRLALLFIRDAMTLLIHNLFLLTTTDDERDPQYTSFMKLYRDHTLEKAEYADVLPNLVDKLSIIMAGSGVLGSVRSVQPFHDKKVYLSPQEKEMIRYEISQKITGAMHNLAQLYDSVLNGQNK